jgi:hypothetical protein
MPAAHLAKLQLGSATLLTHRLKAAEVGQVTRALHLDDASPCLDQNNTAESHSAQARHHSLDSRSHMTKPGLSRMQDAAAGKCACIMWIAEVQHLLMHACSICIAVVQGRGLGIS